MSEMNEDRARNGSAADRSGSHSYTDWRTWAVGLLVCAFLASLGSAVKSADSADSARNAASKAQQAIRAARSVESHDNNAQRQTAFRLCTRNKVDRAFAHYEVERRGGLKVVRLLSRPEFLPILDCSPNLYGNGAKPLSFEAQQAYVKRWHDGDLTARERGVCPNSKIGVGEDPFRC